MPNDRGNSSLLQQANLTKYKTLSKFLNLTSDLQQSTGESAGVLDSNQALDLLNQAIDEATAEPVQPVASGTVRQKELSPPSESLPVAETKPDAEVRVEAPTAEPEVKNNSEIAELGQEIAEVGKEVKEQRDQEELKAQQAAINDLAAQVATPLTDVKPVVVLPISEEKQQEAKYKSTHFSLRWLAEWAKKISKIFSGAVIYKEEVVESEDA